MRTTILLSGLAAAVAACGGDSTTCGTGTTKMGSECIADNGGSNSGSNTGSDTGNDTTCGTGTHLEGTMCVPDDNGTASAPTVSSITPTEAGIAGGSLFTLTGTGFAGTNVTSLHVYFGDPSNAMCEATDLGAVSATELSGQVPTDCTLSAAVTVTVTTNLGSATTPFQYDMIFAGDGLAGAGLGNQIWVIDPATLQAFDLGAPTDGTQNQNPYSYAGMDFDATGTLYAVTTGLAASDPDLFTSQLITIDLKTGAVTVLGETLEGGANPYMVRDIKFVGGTLYGWAYTFDANGNDFDHQLVSISTTDGSLTLIGAAAIDDTLGGGLAVDGTGVLIAAVNGAASDANALYPTSGEIDTVNTMTGAMSNAANIDWGIGSPIQAMTTFTSANGPLILAAVDNGEYGAENPDQNGNPTFFGVTLAIIDVANESISPVFELPARTGEQSHVDALAVPPSTLVIARQLPRTGWKQLKAPAHAVALPLVRR